MFEIVKTHLQVQLSLLLYYVGANVSIISAEMHDDLLRYGDDLSGYHDNEM